MQEAVQEIPVPPNCVVVQFDPDSNTVSLGFDNNSMKCWSWVVAVLKMGIDEAETKRRFAQIHSQQDKEMRERQAAALAAGKAQAISQKIQLGRA